MTTTDPNFQRYFDISDNGFLPQRQLKKLPEYFKAWEMMAKSLPESNQKGTTRTDVKKIPLLNWQKLQNLNQFKRAYSILSMIANSYVWCQGPLQPVKILPYNIAIPFWNISNKLGISPILTHAAVDLFNWKLKDKSKGMELDNLKSTYTMTGMQDEEWFYLIMVAIEAEGGKMLKSVINIQNHMETNDKSEILKELKNINSSLLTSWKIILRTREKCTPENFYNKLRIYLSGWNEGSETLKGLVYEGVDSEPKQYSGGSAAQSSLFQVLDALFKIDHTDDYFKKIRNYMPETHRDFVEFVNQNINIRDYISVKKDKDLESLYNDCVNSLVKFRMAHRGIVGSYVIKMKQGKDHFGNKGTGGTELQTFLQTSIDETKKVKY